MWGTEVNGKKKIRIIRSKIDLIEKENFFDLPQLNSFLLKSIKLKQSLDATSNKSNNVIKKNKKPVKFFPI